jgi:hypothetical protein
MLQDGIESQCGTSGAQLLEPPSQQTHHTHARGTYIESRQSFGASPSSSAQQAV